MIEKSRVEKNIAETTYDLPEYENFCSIIYKEE